MIDVALAILLLMIFFTIFLFLLAALISLVDQQLDGLITKKIKKRFGGDE